MSGPDAIHIRDCGTKPAGGVAAAGDGVPSISGCYRSDPHAVAKEKSWPNKTQDHR